MNPIHEVRLRYAQLRDVYRHFGELVRKERGWLLLAGVALLGDIAFQVLAPFPVKYIVDGVLTPGAGAHLWGVPPGYPVQHRAAFIAIVCGAMLLFALLGGLCAYLSAVWAAEAGQRIVFKLRKRLYAHMQKLSLRFHRDHGIGDLLMRMTGDISMLREVLVSSGIDLAGNVVSIVVMIAVLFFLDARLALISLAVLITTMILTGVSTTRIARAAKRQRESEGVLADAAGEALASIALVKAFGCEEQMLEAFARQNRSSLRKSVKGTRMQAALARRVEILFAVAVAAVFAFGVFRIGNGFSAGDLIIFVSFVNRLNKPLRKIAGMASRIGKGAACADRIVDVLAIEPEEVDQPGALPAPAFRGEIAIENLRFGYEPERPVLDGIYANIAAGQTVGLVGRNGAGKSTLLHLLLRFFEPQAGRILFDGADIRAFTIRSLREQVSIALQSTLLFGGPIRENLLCAAPHASDAEIQEALQRAGADFVGRLPDGVDTELSQQGVNLSGGERRKLALAAALLRRAPILVLDEPTTHIDRASQEEIIRRLPDLTRGRTSIIISHDPEMLERLDRVLFLDQGRILGDGTHAELAARLPEYRALFPEGEARELARSA